MYMLTQYPFDLSFIQTISAQFSMFTSHSLASDLRSTSVSTLPSESTFGEQIQAEVQQH